MRWRWMWRRSTCSGRDSETPGFSIGTILVLVRMGAQLVHSAMGCNAAHEYGVIGMAPAVEGMGASAVAPHYGQRMRVGACHGVQGFFLESTDGVSVWNSVLLRSYAQLVAVF